MCKDDCWNRIVKNVDYAVHKNYRNGFASGHCLIHCYFHQIPSSEKMETNGMHYFMTSGKGQRMRGIRERRKVSLLFSFSHFLSLSLSLLLIYLLHSCL